MELFKCERLSATISQKQCDINRHGKPAGPNSTAIKACFACDGCPGLGASVNIEQKEALVAVKFCSVRGCGTKAHSRNMCWKHVKSELGINPPNGKPLTDAELARVAKPAKKTAPPEQKLIKPEDFISLKSGTLNLQTGALLPIADVEAKVEVKVPASFGLVTNGEGKQVPFGVDEVIYLALDEALEAKKQEWLCELSGLKPGQTIARAVQMVNALEGLVY